MNFTWSFVDVININNIEKSDQEYEARLFRLNKSRKGVMEHASAEEMVDLQKKKSARDHFFFGLSSRNKDVNVNPSSVDNEEPSKRNASDSVIVSHLIYHQFGPTPITHLIYVLSVMITGFKISI